MTTIYLGARDSLFRNKDNNEFTFDLSAFPLGKSYSGYKIALEHVIWNNLHPTFHRYNQYFYFKENAGATLTGSIPEGYYSVDTLEVALKTALESVGTSTYTISYDDTTKKLTMDAGADVITLVEGEYSVYESLGFLGTESGSIIVGDHELDIAGPGAILVETSLPVHSYNSSLRCILAEIPVEYPVGYQNTYYPKHLHFEKFNGYTSQLIIRLFESKNGHPYVLSLNTDLRFKFNISADRDTIHLK